MKNNPSSIILMIAKVRMAAGPNYIPFRFWFGEDEELVFFYNPQRRNEEVDTPTYLELNSESELNDEETSDDRLNHSKEITNG